MRRARPAATLTVLVATLAGCGSRTPAAPHDTAAGSGSTAAAPSRSTLNPGAALRFAVAPFRLPATLSRAVAAPGPGGAIEVLGGLHDGERSTNAVLKIDPAGAVTVDGRLPQAVHDAAGGMLAGVPTVLGGGSSKETGAIQQLAPSGPTVAGSLPVPTSDAVAAATSRGLLMVGGYDGQRALDQILLISSPGNVVRVGALATPVRYPAVGVLGTGGHERVLVVGGESAGVATDVVQEVDPATGKARVLAHLPAPRTQACALTLGGSLYVFGGASSGTTGARIFSDVLRWDDGQARFVPAGQLPYPVADAAPVSPDGRTGYLIGGEGPARVATTIVASIG